MSPPPKLSRRTLTFGAIAVAGAAVVAGAIYEVPKLFKRRARGENADLANLLADPDQAAVVGRAIRAQMDPGPSVDAGVANDNLIREFAAETRKRLKHETLQYLLQKDTAARGTLTEVGGWVMPATLALLCVMAVD